MYSKFIENYKGPLIKFVCCGGGFNLAKLLCIAGASKAIHSLTIYYDRSSLPFVYEGSVVSEDFIDKLAEEISERDILTVLISAAYISNRYRKGDHHAFISIINKCRVTTEINSYHISLQKPTLPEYNRLEDLGRINNRRDEEDEAVTRIVLALINKEMVPALRIVDSFKEISYGPIA